MGHFGETLRRLREAKHLSQERFAADAGVSRSTVQKVELEAVPSVHGENYRKMAKALGLSGEQLDALWRDDAAPPAPPMIVPERRLREYARERGINPDVAVELVVAYLRFSAEQFNRGDDLPGIIEVRDNPGPTTTGGSHTPSAGHAGKRRRR
jgi:transcriptional regulator with XRE-family HTH domain